VGITTQSMLRHSRDRSIFLFFNEEFSHFKSNGSAQGAQIDYVKSLRKRIIGWLSRLAREATRDWFQRFAEDVIQGRSIRVVACFPQEFHQGCVHRKF